MATVIESNLVHRNRMLQVLESAKEPLTRELLITECASSPEGGMTQDEAMKALYSLKQDKFVYVNEFTSPSTYCLTAAGRSAVPPKYVKDLTLYKQDSGMKHIVGMNGKIDLSKPLKGAKKALYEALVRPMTMRQLSIAANMRENDAYVYIDVMVKIGIISKEKSNEGVVFKRAMQMKTEEEEAKEPPKPYLTPAVPNDPIVESIIKNATPMVSNFSKANISLKEALDELMQRYSAAEIVFELFCRMEADLKDLTQFRDQILTTAKVAKK